MGNQLFMELFSHTSCLTMELSCIGSPSIFSHLEQVLYKVCLFKLLFLLNDILHFSHWNGFKPEWVLVWLFKLLDCMKTLGHCVHLKGLSPLWTLLCTIKWFWRSKDQKHSLHLKGLFPICFTFSSPLASSTLNILFWSY